MAYFGVLLLVFSVFGPVFVQQVVRINDLRENLEANRIATVTEKEINTAIRFGHGYSRNFTLPTEIGSSDYNLTVVSENRLLRVAWDRGSVTKQLTGKKLQGSPSPGKNHLKNIGGTVVFE